ncbi:uncharacterized protein LOC124657333 [Lolium rigidum]|uniref:uncharacterized protein LOC124657333 n=1 Tax=Lolium rigidum TaxID=89674 RepID=UPI001F5D5B56|nr:uncharacterized protein LOC124657333 [Lolium rigidum]
MGRKQRNGKRTSARLVGAICKCKAKLAATERRLRKLKSASSSSTWTTPKKGRLKVNFDGSSMSKSSSIGGVVRDHRGNFILGYAQRIDKATSSVAELLALKRGLELAVKNRWRNISIEGDFKTAVDAIASRARIRAKKDLGQWRKIAGLLPRLGKTTVSHVVRKGNKVAHGFAKLGYEEAAMRQRVWRDVPPEEVLQYLERDAQRKYSLRAEI